jgi:hypothetical protein
MPKGIRGASRAVVRPASLVLGCGGRANLEPRPVCIMATWALAFCVSLGPFFFARRQGLPETLEHLGRNRVEVVRHDEVRD